MKLSNLPSEIVASEVNPANSLEASGLTSTRTRTDGLNLRGHWPGGAKLTTMSIQYFPGPQTSFLLMLVFSLDFIILSNSNTSRSTCEGLSHVCPKKKYKTKVEGYLQDQAHSTCTAQAEVLYIRAQARGNYAKLRLAKGGQLPSEAERSRAEQAARRQLAARPDVQHLRTTHKSGAKPPSI